MKQARTVDPRSPVYSFNPVKSIVGRDYQIHSFSPLRSASALAHGKRGCEGNLYIYLLKGSDPMWDSERDIIHRSFIAFLCLGPTRRGALAHPLTLNFSPIKGVNPVQSSSKRQKHGSYATVLRAKLRQVGPYPVRPPAAPRPP